MSEANRYSAAIRAVRPYRGAAVGIACLLLVNLAVDVFGHGTFFHLEVRDGHLYGMSIDVLKHGAKIAVAALGMMLVIGTGGVDLSIGAIAASGAALAAVRVAAHGDSFAFAAASALLLGALFGFWNGALVAFFRIQPIVATLVLMVAGRGIAQLITDGQIVTFTDSRFAAFANGHFLFLPVPLILMLAVAVAIRLLLRRTGIGLMLETVGDNPRAAHFAGVPTERVVLLAYVVAGMAAAMTGLFFAGDIKGADANHCGLFLELDAIFAVVVGGTSLSGGKVRILGTILGAFLIQGLTTTLYALDVPAEVIPMPKALVILIVALSESEAFRLRIKGAGRAAR